MYVCYSLDVVKMCVWFRELFSDAEERAKKKEKRELFEKYNSNVMRELREEFSEAPVERSEISGASAVVYKKVEKVILSSLIIVF